MLGLVQTSRSTKLRLHRDRWSRRPVSNAGFSAIELVMVLSIAISLTATSVPAIMTALRRSAVTRSADQILMVAEQAQALSRRVADAKKRFGVAVVSDPGFLPDGAAKGTYAILIYGNSLSDVAGFDVTMPVSDTNQPLMVKRLNNNVGVFTSMTEKGKKPDYTILPSGGFVLWFYSNGLPQTVGGVQTVPGLIQDSAGNPVEIGTTATSTNNALVSTWPSEWKGTAQMTPTALTPQFGVCSISGDFGVNIVIFNCGLTYAHEITRTTL